MRLSLTTSGLLDPRQLSSWSAERQRAIRAAVAKGMYSGGREVRDAARNQMRSAWADIDVGVSLAATGLIWCRPRP